MSVGGMLILLHAHVGDIMNMVVCWTNYMYL